MVRADAYITFVEAPPPTAPIYMKLESQFYTLSISMGREPIPDCYKVKVHEVLKDHPESLRVWEN